MNKLLYVIEFLAVISTANAGTATRGATSIPPVPNLSNHLETFSTRIAKLDELDLKVSEYKKLQSDIIEEFLEERRKVHRELRATEILTCKVEAKRPGLFKGRNKDKCAIANDISKFSGWQYVRHIDRLIHQFGGGSNNYTVTPVNSDGIMVLSVNCISPSQKDTTSGRFGRTHEITIEYKKTDSKIEKDARLEASDLLF